MSQPDDDRDPLALLAHELRSPLNVIIGFSSLLAEQDTPISDQERREYAADILQSARQLLQLVNDAVELARSETGRLRFEPEAIHLPELVADVVQSLQREIGPSAARSAIHVDPALGVVELDQARLREVLRHFLLDAWLRAPASGAIALSVTGEGPEAFRIEVEVPGLVLGEAELSARFEPLAEIGPKRRGLALALAVSKRLVEAQGGTIGARGGALYAVLPRSMRFVERHG